MILFYTAHGIELLLPFDITKVTFLVTKISMQLSITSLLTIHTCILQECNKDLAKIHDHILAACYSFTQEFERKNINHIVNYGFKVQKLVLVLNKKIEPNVSQKCKPHYFGPTVVVTQLQNGRIFYWKLIELSCISNLQLFALSHIDLTLKNTWKLQSLLIRRI